MLAPLCQVGVDQCRRHRRTSSDSGAGPRFLFPAFSGGHYFLPKRIGSALQRPGRINRALSLAEEYAIVGIFTGFLFPKAQGPSFPCFDPAAIGFDKGILAHFKMLEQPVQVRPIEPHETRGAAATERAGRAFETMIGKGILG